MKLTPIFFTFGLALLSQHASAQLLIGYNSFGSLNDTTPDFNLLPGSLTAKVSSGAFSSNPGSSDLFYGPDSSLYGGLPTGPGTASNGRIDASGASFTVTNTSARGFQLSSLLFDLTSSSASNNSFSALTYKIAAGSAVNLITSGKVKGANLSGNPSTISSPFAVPAFNQAQNYSDFIANLTGLSLLAGQSIVFTWTAGSQVRLDNIALNAVPETASVLALSLLIGGGLMMRSRRGIAAPTLA